MATMNTGAGSAAVLAAGIGSMAMGVLTTLSEVSSGIGGALNWYGPVGALSGKSTLSVLIWLVVWLALHTMWRNRALDEARVFKAAYILIAIGFLGTFPPVFELLQFGH